MGRPAQVKPPVTGANRRDFFRRSGAGTVALAASTPWLPLAADAALAASPVFAHGVASGDPLADRVILWTRISPATAKAALSVTFVVALDPALTQVVLQGSAKTNPAREPLLRRARFEHRPLAHPHAVIELPGLRRRALRDRAAQLFFRAGRKDDLLRHRGRAQLDGAAVHARPRGAYFSDKNDFDQDFGHLDRSRRGNLSVDFCQKRRRNR